MEFNDKYEKLMAAFVPQTYYTHGRGVKTILEGPNLPRKQLLRVQNKQENTWILSIRKG